MEIVEVNREEILREKEESKNKFKKVARYGEVKRFVEEFCKSDIKAAKVTYDERYMSVYGMVASIKNVLSKNEYGAECFILRNEIYIVKENKNAH